MKAQAEQDGTFQPFDLRITFESEDEVANFYAMIIHRTIAENSIGLENSKVIRNSINNICTPYYNANLAELCDALMEEYGG